MPRITTRLAAGAGVGAYNVINAVTAHGASGGGVSSDSAALAAAFASGSSTKRVAYLPPGTYLLGSTLTSTGGSLHVVGHGAKIKWDSVARKAIEFASDATSITIEGVTFEGNIGETELSHGNIQDALYFPSGNYDITLRDCSFVWCRPNSFGGNSYVHTGRLKVDNCLFENCTSVLNAPSNSEIRDSWFVNPAGIVGTNHGIYVFGEVNNVTVEGCHFVDIAGNAIKFNSASSRYGHKHIGVISGCHFTNGALDCIWAGGDGSSDAIISALTVTGNTFHNTKALIHSHNVSDLTLTGNTATWDWEATGTATAGIEVSSAIGLGNLSPARNINISGNTLRQQHPFAGALTFTGIPADGDTFTVGSVTYTWKTSPSAATDIAVAASASAAAQAAMTALRGSSALAMNAVLRGAEDVFFEDQAGDVANPTLVIASDATFTLTESSSATTLTAVADKRVCTSAYHINETQNVSVRGNTFENFSFAYITKSVEPVVEGNTYIDCIIDSRSNVFSKYKNNTITRNRARDAGRSGQESIAWIRCSDAWPIISGNGLKYVQHYSCAQMLGGSGRVTISNGKAYADLFYGEPVSDTSSSSLAFRWNDGDTVQIRDPYATVHTCTFKRTSPGADEFNSSASLITWIGTLGGGGFSAAFVSTQNYSDDVWLRVTHSVAADYGDNCWIKVSTRSQTCGQLLIDPDANPPANDRSYFRGSPRSSDSPSGSPLVGITRTWCWTQLANANAVPRLQGVTAAAQALNPIVYPADIEPGRGFYITHSASQTGAEEFLWFLEAP